MAVLSPSVSLLGSERGEATNSHQIQKERQIEKIQSTPEWVQKELMLCIEEVSLGSTQGSGTFVDDSYASIGQEQAAFA